MSAGADGPRFRRFVVHGWAFRSDLSHEATEGIKGYIKTGDPDKLPFNYRRLRDKLKTDPTLKDKL